MCCGALGAHQCSRMWGARINVVGTMRAPWQRRGAEDAAAQQEGMHGAVQRCRAAPPVRKKRRSAQGPPAHHPHSEGRGCQSKHRAPRRTGPP